MFYFTTLKPEK